MGESDMVLGDPNEVSQENMQKFWKSLSTWYVQPEIAGEYFKENYLDYNIYTESRDFLDIDYEREYMICYGVSYPHLEQENRKITLVELQDFIEIMYERWIKPEKHYAFTIEINKKFDKFHLPYKLSSGKVKGKGYKTTETVDVILNYRMFERKIAFSEQMIMSSDMLEKKCALDFIVDALQYYISVQDAQGKDKQYAEAAKTVCEDTNSKIYSVVKREIEEIMKQSNEYFDIRHNDYLNGAKQEREALDDLQFIEYLYNRVYALLYLLRLKVKKEKLISEKID